MWRLPVKTVVALSLLLLAARGCSAAPQCAVGAACAPAQAPGFAAGWSGAAPAGAATDGVFWGAGAAAAAAAAGAALAPYVPPAQLPAGCKAAAVADLDARVAAPGYDYRTAVKARDTWGPHPTRFPPVTPASAPPGCNPDAWAQWRIMGAIERMVAQGYCYCHHHVPSWMPSIRARGDGSGVCNPDCPGRRAYPYQGVDCSTYSAYLYNLAFGLSFTAAIGKQACMPGYAPGRLLPYTANQPEAFRPGDILFITPSISKFGPTAPGAIRISHAIVWTGHTVDFTTTGRPFSWDTIIANVNPKDQASMMGYVNARRAAGLPVYVITDSHWTGPNYRPFAGWYVNSFSHARRVIAADPSSLPPPAIGVAAAVSWDGKDCESSVCCAGN